MVPSNLPPAVGRDKEGSIHIHHATSRSLEQHTVYGVIFHTGHTWEPSKRPCSESWEHGCSHQKLVRATLWDQLVFLYLDIPLLPHHHHILICVIFISFPWIKLQAERERENIILYTFRLSLPCGRLPRSPVCLAPRPNASVRSRPHTYRCVCILPHWARSQESAGIFEKRLTVCSNQTLAISFPMLTEKSNY